MGTIRAKLAGWKTYIVTGIGIATALVAYGDGAATSAQTLAAIFAAITAMTLRAGIQKTQDAVTGE